MQRPHSLRKRPADEKDGQSAALCNAASERGEWMRGCSVAMATENYVDPEFPLQKGLVVGSRPLRSSRRCYWPWSTLSTSGLLQGGELGEDCALKKHQS